MLNFMFSFFSIDYGRRKRNAFRIQVEKGESFIVRAKLSIKLYKQLFELIAFFFLFQYLA